MAFVLITDPEEAADMYEERVTWRLNHNNTPVRCQFDLSRDAVLRGYARQCFPLRLYYLTEE